MIHLKVLPAGYGDALLLSWQGLQRKHHILIDGGVNGTFSTAILPEIETIIQNNEFIDLVITTHIDSDHITGILDLADRLQKKLLPENLVKQWWFNSGSLIDQHFKGSPSLTSKKLVYYNQSRGNTQISYRQGASLEDFLIKTGRWYSQLICTSHPAITIGEAQITILSPTESVLSKLSENWADYFKEKKDTQISRREHDFNTSIEELARRSYIRDPSLVNQSSIAFLFELKGTRLIFLADATPEIYLAALKKLIEVRNLKKLAINAVKLAHHAGKHNFLPELLDLIDCQHFLISTDGSRHMLPNKETLAKIILHPERQPGAHTFFHFNYKNTLLQHIFDKNIALLHNFQCVFPVPSENGSNLEWNDD